MSEDRILYVDAPAPVKPAVGLYAKLSQVMALVGRIEKRGENTFHHYKYATESDIVEAVRMGLAERLVMIVPSVREVHREGTLTTVLMTFSLVDGQTGEVASYDWAGTGDDKGDKGLYKAMTGALKYFLLKTFLMPTGDDPEADEATDKRAAGVATKRGGGRAGPSVAEQCARCSAPREPGSTYCATCNRLAMERKADDAMRAAKEGGTITADGVVPSEKPLAPSAVPTAASERRRAFALMDRYGISNDAAHRPDRLATYGKALKLGRLATDTEAKAFTAQQWTAICEWLQAANEPPDEDAPPFIGG
jgi:hypothetical protein